jgi:glycine/D-amino acid oxidase-like deaminating enzyme
MMTKDSKIVVVGGGVFGLSTSLWLARGGYRDVTVFDRCQFDKNFYNPADGCDGASADLNKIFRISYAEKLHYQNMAIEARDMWISWNNAIAGSDASALPPGLEPDDKLLHECGCYYVGDGQDMKEYYAESLRSIERTAPHLRKKQFIKVRSLPRETQEACVLTEKRAIPKTKSRSVLSVARGPRSFMSSTKSMAVTPMASSTQMLALQSLTR